MVLSENCLLIHNCLVPPVLWYPTFYLSGVGPGALVQGGGLHPGFGPGRDAPVRGAYGIFRNAPDQGGRGQELGFGLGRETAGGLQGLGELDVGGLGLEGGYQDAAMGKYMGGGGGGVWGRTIVRC